MTRIAKAVESVAVLLRSARVGTESEESKQFILIATQTLRAGRTAASLAKTAAGCAGCAAAGVLSLGTLRQTLRLPELGACQAVAGACEALSDLEI